MAYTLTLSAVNDLNGAPMQYAVNWGDGGMNTYTTLGSVTHTFANAGAVNITVDLTDATGTYRSAGALRVTVVPASASLFTSSVDIGSPKLAGSASLSNGIYTVVGEGIDIWNTTDQFHYYYKNVSGDATIIAQVTSVQNVNSWAKAGVMIRNGTAANAAFADVVVTPAGYLAFQSRANAGGACSQTVLTSKEAPQFVKLLRTGNSFAAWYSADGKVWAQLGAARTIAMAPAVTTGLAVTSINTAATCTATFANVSTM